MTNKEYQNILLSKHVRSWSNLKIILATLFLVIFMNYFSVYKLLWEGNSIHLRTFSSGAANSKIFFSLVFIIFSAKIVDFTLFLVVKIISLSRKFLYGIENRFFRGFIFSDQEDEKGKPEFSEFLIWLFPVMSVLIPAGYFHDGMLFYLVENVKTKDDFVTLVFATILLCSLVLILFYPYIRAKNIGHPNAKPILLTLIFFGWTIIGYFVALIWSYTAFENKDNK